MYSNTCVSSIITFITYQKEDSILIVSLFMRFTFFPIRISRSRKSNYSLYLFADGIFKRIGRKVISHALCHFCEYNKSVTFTIGAQLKTFENPSSNTLDCYLVEKEVNRISILNNDRYCWSRNCSVP